MTRVRSTPAPVVTTPARSTERPTAPAKGSTTAPAKGAGWVGGPGARKPALLESLKGTLTNAPTKDGGPAKLPKAIAGVPVASAKVVHFDGLKGTNGLQQQGVDVRFGQLSKPQFEALKTEFGGASKVPYDAKREYTAVDFMPPALQALVNKDLDPGKTVELKGTAKLRDLGESDYTISVTPNCHGTAYEAMRAYQGTSPGAASLYFGDAQAMDGLYADAQKFKTLGTAKPGEAPAFLSQLKPGDVVAFNRHEKDLGDMELLHSAVYVGGGMFFEKPDTEMDEYSETPYRLVTYEQMTAPITEFLGEPPSVTARRPTAPLESGASAFAFSDEGKLEGWAAKKGQTLGLPLVVELEVGMGGGVRGYHATAVDTRRLSIGADGRGVVD